MESAADLVRMARRRRQLTRKELATLAGVSPSTVSRIEAGKVDPAFGTLTRLLTSAGYRFDTSLVADVTDDAIVAAITSKPSLDEVFDVYRVAAQVCPVRERAGAQVVVSSPDDMLSVFDDADVDYAFSALEGFYGGWSSSMGRSSFWPVVYVDPNFTVPWPEQPFPGRRRTVYLLPLTENAQRFRVRKGALWTMTSDWSLIDTIASPDRQSDVGMELLEALVARDRQVAA